jgi:hypothetical protein
MSPLEQHPGSMTVGRAITAGLCILLATAFAVQAQTFTALHTFTGGGDGPSPPQMAIQLATVPLKGDRIAPRHR